MNRIYFNTAASGLIDKVAIEVINQFNKRHSREGSLVDMEWREEELPSIRNTASRYFNTSEGNIAFVPSFSYALNAVIHSLPKNLKIMVYTPDFPSVELPFRVNGFNIIEFNDPGLNCLSEERLKDELIKSKVDVLAISHVQWLTGYKLDLADLGEFCSANEIKLIVDATQSMGLCAFDFDSLKVDVLLGSCYKWFNVGYGCGFLLAKKSFLQQFEPRVAGFSSYPSLEMGTAYQPSVRSYEPGHLNMPVLSALKVIMQNRLKVGLIDFEREVSDKVQYLLNEFTRKDIPFIGESNIRHRAGIVALTEKPGIYDRLLANDIIVAQRGPNLRISIHYHNTYKEIDRLVSVISE